MHQIINLAICGIMGKKLRCGCREKEKCSEGCSETGALAPEIDYGPTQARHIFGNIVRNIMRNILSNILRLAQKYCEKYSENIIKNTLRQSRTILSNILRRAQNYHEKYYEKYM